MSAHSIIHSMIRRSFIYNMNIVTSTELLISNSLDLRSQDRTEAGDVPRHSTLKPEMRVT